MRSFAWLIGLTLLNGSRHGHARSLSRPGLNLQAAAEEGRAIAHRAQPEAPPGALDLLEIEPLALVADLQAQCIVEEEEIHLGPPGTAVPDGIAQRLLGDLLQLGHAVGGVGAAAAVNVEVSFDHRVE